MSAHATPAHVRVEGLSRHFGTGESRVEVLHDVSFSVAPGGRCVIVGASGSGKSTLLNAIGGLDSPDAGSIHVAGQEITALSPRGLTRYRRDHVGFVFQFYNLVPDLTVRENVQVTAQLVRRPLDIDDLLHHLGLDEHRHKFPAQLSGGQQQRCAIARALVKGSDLLLCDEPTGALDRHTSQQMLEVLEDVHRRYGTTLVMVTHNEAITALADQVIELRDGRIVRDEMNTHPRAAEELDW
ncbi:ABC transporter ATP-binding protein [Raineyella fluvialis]|uniref:ATP-binding cassette domain-containing protein n=1 Tax=Raineyella fluvialis TaxID=2662261 RepID=A0A5Q2FCP3_9ACTN|nr:ABC transporter ATP-binding protein [Raineyella fluvialis]QGF24692.1 ATP-binding cassette domain-containing protein [Raineyella fluvialis]